MNLKKAVPAALGIMVFAFTAGVSLYAADAASQADRDFVAKVSQGGLYEVEAGKVAAIHGKTLATKNFGVLESHDHQGVNASLKQIAVTTGVTITPGLNPEFSERLAKLKAVPADQFDAFYLADMQQIHNKDEGLFVQETAQGTSAYKQFAQQTATLVKAHLGWLNSL